MKIKIEVEVPDGSDCSYCKYTYVNDFTGIHVCTIFGKELEELGKGINYIFRKCYKCLEATEKSNS